MAMVKKSISVTDQQDSWIKAQIANGYYGNDSEVIRELIRERQLAQRRETPEEIAVIRRKLETAEARGFTEQSAEEILAEIKEELRLDGKL